MVAVAVHDQITRAIVTSSLVLLGWLALKEANLHFVRILKQPSEGFHLNKN